MSDNNVLTAKHMKAGAGLLAIFAVVLIAFGLGKIFGAGIAWLLVGVFVMLWARRVRKAVKDGEYAE